MRVSAMPDWIFTRQSVIALAIAGGLCSLLVSVLQPKGILSEKKIYWLRKFSYAFMAASIALFIGAGFLA